MPNLKLKSKNFRINEENFESIPDTQFGNFAFGYINRKSRFVPNFVGHSNNNLKDEMKAVSHQKKQEGKRYTHFKFEAARDRAHAYEKECKNYHDYKFRKDGTTSQLESMHPTGGTCPIGGCFGQ